MARVVSIDFTGVEAGTQFTRVPEGDYALEIKKVLTKKSESSGEKYLSIHFELSQGPKKGNGKVLPHTCSLQKQALWNLRNVLEACGKQVPSKAVKLDLDKVIGWTCAGTVVDDEYEGRKKSQISAIFPLADLGATEEDGEAAFGEDEEEEAKPAKSKKAKGKKPAADEEEADEEAGSEEEEELFS